jgi:hypothetical protein
MGTGLGGLGKGGGTGSAVLDSIQKTVPLETVAESVDSALDYPTAFRERGITGTVTAEVLFDGEGRLIKRSARSDSRYLRVHILRVLRSTLSEGLPRTYTRGEPLRIQFRFDFVLSDKDQVTLLPRRGFHFQRIGRPFGQWEVGPLTGFWMVPAVGIDLDWFARQFEKEKADPLDIYRMDPDW